MYVDPRSKAVDLAGGTMLGRRHKKAVIVSSIILTSCTSLRLSRAKLLMILTQPAGTRICLDPYGPN